ncbi:hypothetical protein PHYSODRAFT_294442 [Phytophthora sojae]|uniref:Uncharacterized protein n=1 Tax=Phytophthora sojae (strain P6497) TaxID=1094619 RepID=G4YJ21_PHYSP|nr:hypothetical protein PHYSODRAFT_294442 [Phytophthora sojae]EGZ29161.1 hypothetical protein PHYSODRAFT_294442 [Phytophthora sojae]|eukprot:XP_009516436.1 hypothetical protein PHYSODRAFT_294442 [Phytophthora sojae]
MAHVSDPVESEMAEVAQHAVENNVWFSRISLALRFDSQDIRSGWGARSSFGKLMRSLFDSTRRTLDDANTFYRLQTGSESLYQLGKIYVESDDEELERWGVKAMLSSLVRTQTRELKLMLEQDPIDQNAVGRLSVEDIQGFIAVIASDHPEEELFSSHRGVVDDRNATLEEGAPMHWEFGEAQRDDGVSEWVNVLVPGYGRCQVKRSDLNFDGDGSTDTMGVGITSLSIRLNPNCEIAGDLSQFMAAVGALKDVGSQLEKCLHRLRICLANPFVCIPHGYDPGNYEADLIALLDMLEVNRSLEYLGDHRRTHRTFIDRFAQYDKEPISKALKLPLEAKIAFLSVVGPCGTLRPTKKRKSSAPTLSAALCKLDRSLHRTY